MVAPLIPSAAPKVTWPLAVNAGVADKKAVEIGVGCSTDRNGGAGNGSIGSEDQRTAGNVRVAEVKRWLR